MGSIQQIRSGIPEPIGADSFLSAARAELSRARIAAKAWAESLSASRRDECALLFARAALLQLAKSVNSSPRVEEQVVPFVRLDDRAEQLAAFIGTTAAYLPLEESLHLTTSLYPALLSSFRRSELGAFYTPPALVNRLFDLAENAGLNWQTCRILDPAAGGGAFLFEGVRRIIRALAGCRPALVLEAIERRLQGFELDPHAASLARIALDVQLSHIVQKAGRPVGSIVAACDTLDVAPDPAFDLVIGNPPYGRIALSADHRKRYARGLYGHANLYGVFTDAALRWTRPGGLVAFLTPTSFLAGQYFSSLRAVLAEEAPPVFIDFVHARHGVFEEVLQETLLAVYNRGRKADRVHVSYLSVLNHSKVSVKHNGTIGLPLKRRSPWLAPRSPDHSVLIANAEKMNCRLANWGYSVSTGPLVWNRFKAQLCHLPDGGTVLPLIWAEAVTSDGRFVFRARKKNHAPYFRLAEGDQWLVVKQPCVLVQRTTAKEQAKRLIAAELPAALISEHGGVVVENHLNMIRPCGDTLVRPAVVSALLNSRIVDELFRCISGSVAVSAFELEALPLPAAHDMGFLTQLVSAGACAELIEKECARLYGQTEA